MFEKSINSLYNTNWVLRVLYDKFFKKYGAFKTTFLLFIIPIILCYIAGYLEGTLYNIEGSLIGVIKDYTLYALWLVVLFAIYLYYKFSVFVKDFLGNKIEEIIDKQKVSQKTLEILDNKLASIIGPKGVYKVLMICLIGLFIFFHILNVLKGFNPEVHYGVDIWHSANYPLGFAILKSFNLLYSSLLLAIFIYKFVSSLLGFSWVFKKLSNYDAFLIKPLNPDNCAGLRILSNLSMYFMYMVLPFFIIYLSMILRGTKFLVGQQVSFLALIFLLFVTFFLPLGAVHAAMKRAKIRELENLSDHFSGLNEKVKGRLGNKQYGQEFVTDIESLEKIDFLYSKTEKMPVWPFNVSNLGRLFVAAMIPLFVFLIQLITNADSIIYNMDKLKLFQFLFKE